MPACSYMEEISSVAMLAAKKSAEVTPEVNIREQETHTHLSSGFETQRRRHQKTKTGVPVAPQKGLMSSNFLKMSPCTASICSSSSRSSFSLSRHCFISFSSLSIWFTAYRLKLSRFLCRFPARAASWVFMWTTCAMVQEQERLSVKGQLPAC